MLPYWKDSSKVSGNRKHTLVLHTCECGRVVRGNAFYIHYDSCLVAQKHERERIEEIQREYYARKPHADTI